MIHDLVPDRRTNPSLRLTFAKYREFLSYPTWNYVTQAFRNTRSYDLGLDWALLHLRFTEENSAELSDDEYAHNSILLYTFILSMLEHLNAWAEYVSAWSQIRSNTSFSIDYVMDSATLRDPHMREFVVSERPGVAQIHFLWLTFHEKQKVERKLARQRSGKSVAHLKHKDDALSYEEAQRRLKAILDRAVYASRMSDWMKAVAPR